MKNNVLKILIGLIIIIIIILVIIILILNEQIKNEQSFLGDDDAITWSEDVIKVDNATMFYTVEDCIRNYLNYCYMEDIKQDGSFYYDEVISNEDKIQYIYDILDADYIKQNNITIDSISNFIETYNQAVTFDAKEMNVLNGEYIDMYAVYGKILSSDEKYIKDSYFIVNIDEMNGSFSVLPLQNYNSVNEIILNNSYTRINENDNNRYQYIRLTEAQLIEKYLENYKKVLNNNIEEAYKLLNEDYRIKKYPTIEDYKKYVEGNKDEIQGVKIARFSVVENEDNKQYICIDRNNNYYIFNENYIMNYDIILDSYTVDIEQVVTRYNEATIENKCAMNIEKIKEALNNQDYKFVYDKLAISFKTNYFPTQDSFEVYAKSNFFKKNAIEYINIENQNNNYIFTVSITDRESPLTNPIEKTIVVQLKEGTDFVFSFSV